MGTFEQINTFVRNFKDGVLQPFSESERKSVDGHDEISLAAQTGHLAGQLTDAAFTALVAKEIPFLKDAKALLPELKIGSSKLVGDSFLHAPASFVPREISIAKSLAHTDAGLRANIDITPETYSLMSDLSHQIESTHIEVTTYKLTNPAKPSEVFEKAKPFKFYKLKGVDTKIGMPVEFADSLEPIRTARQRSAQLDGLQRDRFDDKHASTLPGYDSMLLPEQMPLFLRELPNPSLAKELLLIPEADVKAGAAVDREIPGRVQLFDFQKFRDSYIDTAEAPFYLRHEWSHLSETQNKSLSLAFGVARKFERHGFFAHDTAVDSAAEDWAVHLGENLMDPDSKKYLETIGKAPMRSLVLLQSLKQELAKGEQIMKEGLGGDSAKSIFASPMHNPYRAELNARVELGEQLLLPEVRNLLRKERGGQVSGRGVLAHRYASLMRQNGLELLSSQ